MMRVLRVVAGLALTVALTATIADAQGIDGARTVSFGFAGGLTLPTGDAGDGLKTGYHGQALLQFNPGLPFALRVDGMYHSMDFEDGGGDARVIAGVLNAMFPFGAAGGQVQPYASAGAGIYNLKANYDDYDVFGAFIVAEGSSSTTKVGLNGGLGLRFQLSGLSTFVEARFHNVFTEENSTQLLPITVGLMF